MRFGALENYAAAINSRLHARLCRKITKAKKPNKHVLEHEHAVVGKLRSSDKITESGELGFKDTKNHFSG